MKPLRKCVDCDWFTDFIIKKEDGVCPRCHGVVKFLPEGIMSIKDFSTKELEDELARRITPCPVIHPNWTSVVNYTQTAMRQIVRGDGLPKDFEHYLMETVLEAVYGKEVFTWWNDKLKD